MGVGDGTVTGGTTGAGVLLGGGAAACVDEAGLAAGESAAGARLCAAGRAVVSEPEDDEGEPVVELDGLDLHRLTSCLFCIGRESRFATGTTGCTAATGFVLDC